jgi:hypothetical protein
LGIKCVGPERLRPLEEDACPEICALQTTAAQHCSKSCDRVIAGKLTNQLDRVWGWEAECSCMRVASLESVLAVATLVLAIVVTLWGIKIFYGV